VVCRKILFGLSPVFGLISNWLALKNPFGAFRLFWAENVSIEGNYYSSIFFLATHLQKICDNAIFDGGPRSDLVRFGDADSQYLFCIIMGNVHSVL